MPAHYKDAIPLKFKTSNFELMEPTMKPEPLKPGNDVHLCLVCNSEEEIHSFEKAFLRGTRTAAGKPDVLWPHRHPAG